MSEFLEAVTVPKGKSAGFVLKKRKWPGNLHQKLVDMPYNKPFLKLVNTVLQPPVKPALQPVPRKAVLLVPSATPKQFLVLIDAYAAAMQGFLALHVSRVEMENDLRKLEKAGEDWANKEGKRITALKKKVRQYRVDADKLIQSCVKAANICAGIKYPHQVLMKKYQTGVKELNTTWRKALDEVMADQAVLSKMRNSINRQKKRENALEKTLLRTIQQVSGCSVVMP